MARNVTVQKLEGGLGRRNPTADGTIGLIGNGVSVSGGYQLGTVSVFTSLAEAEAVGLTAAYDTTNDVLVHHHLERVFTRNPSATVRLMLLAQSVTMANLVDIANVANAKKLLKDSNGVIKNLGVFRCPPTGYTVSNSGGLNAEVIAAIPKAQELVDEEFNEFRYVNIVLEGRNFNGTAGDATNLRSLAAPNVSVVIASDLQVAVTDALHNGYAAVGDVMGLISLAAVSQNIGEKTPEFNLENKARGWFIKVGLSSNALMSTYAANALDTLNTKGYIFAETIPGLAGVYLNDSHSATLASSDYAYIENNRTINKAITLARTALLPKVNSRLFVDPVTGFLAISEIAGLEELTRESVRPMLADGDISGGIDAYIDPEQDLLSTSELEIELTFIPRAIARAITLKIGFSNPFNS